MLNETPKHPCRICKKIRFKDRDYSKEPCVSCPLPGEYVEAIENGSFKTMAFLRESRLDHWGIKTAKEKREMEVREMKTCEQCGETKDAENCFDRAPRGFRKICVKCDQDNKEAEGKEKEEVVETPEEKEQSIETPKPINYSSLPPIIDKPGKPGPVIEVTFDGRENLYEKICNIAKSRLRKPEDQVLWWLINTDFEKLEKGVSL